MIPHALSASRFCTTVNYRWTTLESTLEQTRIECSKELSRILRVAPVPWFFCSVFTFPFPFFSFFFGENSCRKTLLLPSCHRCSEVLSEGNVCKYFGSNFRSAEFRIWDINVLLKNSLKCSCESLFFVVLSSVVKTHEVKSLNVCTPLFNGWFKSPHLSTYNFRKKQHFQNKYVDPWVSV